MTRVSAPLVIQSSLRCPQHFQRAVRWNQAPPTPRRQPFAHLPGYPVSSTSCSLLGHLSLPKSLGFWPSAVHWPSPRGKHSFTVNATHTHSTSPLFWGGRGWWRASPEMFPWNHELQGWVLSHLKNSNANIPTCHPIAWT